MMQTTRIRRLDRLVPRGDTEAPCLIFHWAEGDQAFHLHIGDTKESGVTPAGDPVLNSAWDARQRDGQRSL